MQSENPRADADTTDPTPPQLITGAGWDSHNPVTADGHSPSKPPQGGAGSAAWWLESAVVTCTLAVALCGTPVLMFAMLGIARTWVIWACAALSLPVAWVASGWTRTRVGVADSVKWGSVAALLIAAVATAWAGFAPSNHVLIDRDPGSYVSTAKSITDTGSLRVSAHKHAFGSTEGLTFSSAAVYDVGENLEFQFLDLPAATMAAADSLGGSTLLFRTSALAGGLCLVAIYCLSVRMTRMPLLSLAPVAGLALAMPFLSVVRDAYSEPFALLFIWTGVLAIAMTRLRGSIPAAAVTGTLFGAALLARVDSILALLVLVAAMALQACSTDPLDRAGTAVRFRRVTAITAAAFAFVAAVDLFVFSSGYAEMLTDTLKMLGTAVAGFAAASLLATILWRRWSALRRFVLQRRWALGVTAGVTVALVGLYAWLIRPELSVEESARPHWGYMAHSRKPRGSQRTCCGPTARTHSSGWPGIWDPSRSFWLSPRRPPSPTRSS